MSLPFIDSDLLYRGALLKQVWLYFILIKPVFRDHLSYVIVFLQSLGMSQVWLVLSTKLQKEVGKAKQKLFLC